MSGLSPIADHWIETVADYILEQYRDASNWKAILKSVIDKFTGIEEQIWKLAPILDFKCRVKEERPTGALLDFIAGIKNVERNFGESDAAFYERFVAEVSSDNSGTPDNVIYNSAILSGDPKPQYMDEADATFIVYTGPRPDGNGTADGGGHQLLRRQVKKLAPTGVLGLPGAAIQFCDGSLMGDQDGKLMMMVADDATVEHDLVLGDETGNVISTPQGVPVKVVIKGGQTVPTIPVDIGGTTYDAVRIKDLPDAGNENGFMVRDSENGGTVKTKAISNEELDALWDNTPAESDEEEDNG